MRKVFKIGRKTVGVLENGVFSKDVLLSRHLFRKYDAWAIDSNIVHKLPANTLIVIHELEEEKTYRATKEDYLENQRYYHFKLPHEDYQTQLFLPRKFFTVEGKKELTPEQVQENEYLVASGLPKKY